MTEPTISVIVPTYNGSKYIRAAIESAIAQTLQPSEMLIVDDGSTDGTDALCEAIETPFPKYLLRQQNKRQSAARNLAITKATGKYLAFLDHDDIWYPRHLERLIPPLEADERLGWTYSDIDEIDSSGKLISLRVLSSLNAGVQHPKTNIFNMLAADMFIFPSAAVVRRSAFEQVGGFDERLSGYEDDDLFLRLFRAGWLNWYDPDASIRYRRHPASSAFSDRMWRSRDIFAGKLLAEYPDDKELVRYYVRDIIAPRFYGAALAEYYRHLPHQRWEQCHMSVALMRRFTALTKMPLGRRRLRREIFLGLMSNPRLFTFLYPLLSPFIALPRLK